jgi:hypothetical protein
MVREGGALRKYFSHGVVTRVYRVDRTGHIGYPAGRDHPSPPVCVLDLARLIAGVLFCSER